MNVFIGIDNGVTGSIGIINSSNNNQVIDFIETPVFSEQNYTKTKANITRIDTKQLLQLLTPYANNENCIAYLERPMVNPGRFKATVSALRALEATLCVLENLNIAHLYIDSKEWQKALLPVGCHGEELKRASIDIGCRLFPMHKDSIKKHKDADGILIAEYCRQKFRN